MPLRRNASTTRPPLVLGSASPRRVRILQALGYRFDRIVPDVAEVHFDDDPVRTVAENALRKHAAVQGLRPDACRITADTIVFFEGRTVGKPADLVEAATMLGAFSGRTQLVFTAMALALPDAPHPDLRIEASAVHFKELDPVLIRRYLRQTCPLDRAGAYDIDAHGDGLIARCDGSRTNVMGLPAGTLSDWLVANGMPPSANPDTAWSLPPMEGRLARA